MTNFDFVFINSHKLNEGNAKLPAIKRIVGIIGQHARERSDVFSETINKKINEIKGDLESRLIDDYKLEDFNADFEELENLEVANLKVDGYGATDIPNSSERFSLELEIKLYSQKFTCIYIDKEAIKYYGQDKIVKTKLTHHFNTIKIV